MRDRTFTDEDVLRYALGQLDDAGASDVEEHLAASPAARAYLARVRHVTAAMEADLGEMPSAEAVDRVRRAFSRRPAVATVGWLERAERFVARLVFDQRQQPMLAGFRGGGEAAQLAYECDQARVDLRLAPPRSPGAGARARG